MLKKELKKIILDELEKTRWKKFQTVKCCNWRSGTFINIDAMTFEEVFNYVAERCGYGRNYEYHDFFSRKEDIEKVQAIENQYLRWLKGEEAGITDDNYYNCIKEVMNNADASTIDANHGDWELVGLNINNLFWNEDLEKEIEEEREYIIIDYTPEKESNYKEFLIYDLHKEEIKVVNYSELYY